MATETQQATIKIRRDTAANWTSNDPTPYGGEWCLETDTKKIKIGDGSTAWSSLNYSIQPDEKCTAWVNFNGTGTVAIRDSYNVSSITDNGTGNYTINFSTAMDNANYAFVGMSGANGGVLVLAADSGAYDINSLSLKTITVTGTAIDSPNICIAIFGGKS